MHEHGSKLQVLGHRTLKKQLADVPLSSLQRCNPSCGTREHREAAFHGGLDPEAANGGMHQPQMSCTSRSFGMNAFYDTEYRARTKPHIDVKTSEPEWFSDAGVEYCS
jgi:hypothetical protein